MARDYTPKVAKEAVALLPEGEVVRQAVIANPAGGFMDRVNVGDIRVGRAAWKAKKAGDAIQEVGGVAATIPRKNAYLAVTDRRLVIFDLTRMGKLNSVIAAFEPNEIAGLHAEKRDRTTFDLIIGFPDETACQYAVIQKQDAPGFVAAFESLPAIPAGD